MDRLTQRKIRQWVATDGHFGLDAVPLGEATTLEADASPSTPAAAVSPPPVRQPFRAPAAPAASTPAALYDTTPPPLTAHNMTTKQKVTALAELEAEVKAFLEEHWPRDGWQNVVFGEGDPDAKIMFIGEGPGADEDRQGRPFVGRAGQLLDKQIAAMGLKRQQVYIGNIAKCRPPGNRVPTPEEAEKVMPFLERQIEIIAPKAIVSLGATSAKYLLREPKLAITRERGRWRQYRGIDLMPTFHPAFLLRQYTADNRRRVWEDLKKVLEHVGLPVPQHGK